MQMLDSFRANDPQEYARQQQVLRTGEKPLRIRVFASLDRWFEEFRLYHRKDGKIVKLQDDLMAATRYALMMLRHAARAADMRQAARSIDPRRNHNWRV